MHTVTIAVDLAKNVFELAVANQNNHVIERRRLSRGQFERFWPLREPCRVVMEACGSAHFWARRLLTLGFEVVLLPPHTVRPYVQRNKTDRSDCDALLEAVRNPRIHPVSLKNEHQQAIAALHRIRAQWMRTRTARLNGIRGLLREFGLIVPLGAAKLQQRLPDLIENREGQLPAQVVALIRDLWQEILELEGRVSQVERELKTVVRECPPLRSLVQIPGVGLLTATALYASVGNIHAFKSGRHLASWLGLTPKESSSGARRRLGRISKKGDVYLRTLLTHGARSALLIAQRRRQSGQPLSRIQQWAMERAAHQHPNKAVIALANKLARVVWAVWHHERAFDGDYLPATA
jgi:transposase